jgi:predicted helicase
VSAPGGNKDLSALISDCIPDLHFNGDTQCFPLHFYEVQEIKQTNLFQQAGVNYVRRDGVTDFVLKQARERYGNMVSKEDVFYYVYGFLHSPTYRETFAADLKKMLPRLPLVEKTEDFWAFSRAGRKLAELHLNYESVPPHPTVVTLYNPLDLSDSPTFEKLANLSHVANGKDEKEYLNYRVEKMRFPKKDQKDSIIYNSQITIENIPAKAYEYVVNGKSAIEWVMERYAVSVHKESGIKNDPNNWATEHNQPRYILDLLLSVINVSVQTVEIVEGLPKINF